MKTIDTTSKKRLALFFSLGISLKAWDEMGHFSRETRIYKRLAAQFGEVYFLTYGSYDKQYEDVIAPIKVLHKPPGIPVAIYSVLMPFIHWRTLKKVDVLKTNQMVGAWAAVLARFLFKKKLIVRCGYEWGLSRKAEGVRGLKILVIHFIESTVYRFADSIILASSEMKRYICLTLGVQEDKVYVIPNYIETDLFKPMLNLNKIPNRLVFVGRFTTEKNLLNLLKAVERIPEVELVLIGDGPLREGLELYVREHRLRVRFERWIPNEKLPEMLNTADGFIMPSLYEGNPKALLEAMACGLPVIATNVDGNKEIVTHGLTGYLCQGTSANALREGIKDFLQRQARANDVGVNAREFIERNHALDVLLAREIDLLTELLSPTR